MNMHRLIAGGVPRTFAVDHPVLSPGFFRFSLLSGFAGAVTGLHFLPQACTGVFKPGMFCLGHGPVNLICCMKFVIPLHCLIRYAFNVVSRHWYGKCVESPVDARAYAAVLIVKQQMPITFSPLRQLNECNARQYQNTCRGSFQSQSSSNDGKHNGLICYFWCGQHGICFHPPPSMYRFSVESKHLAWNWNFMNELSQN
jgi:hypothetical protein